VSLGFGHDRLCRLVDAVVRTVPVDDDAVDSPADHILNLPVDLRGICGAIANVHMVRSSEPHQQMCINLCRGTRIQQRVGIDFAHIARARIAIGLSYENIGGTGIVGGLSRKRRGGNDVFRRA